MWTRMLHVWNGYLHLAYSKCMVNVERYSSPVEPYVRRENPSGANKTRGSEPKAAWFSGMGGL